jgi:hypothetical protein
MNANAIRIDHSAGQATCPSCRTVRFGSRAVIAEWAAQHACRKAAPVGVADIRFGSGGARCITCGSAKTGSIEHRRRWAKRHERSCPGGSKVRCNACCVMGKAIACLCSQCIREIAFECACDRQGWCIRCFDKGCTPKLVRCGERKL